MTTETCSHNNPFDPDQAFVMAKAGSFGEALRTLAESASSSTEFFQSTLYRKYLEELGRQTVLDNCYAKMKATPERFRRSHR